MSTTITAVRSLLETAIAGIAPTSGPDFVKVPDRTPSADVVWIERSFRVDTAPCPPATESTRDDLVGVELTTTVYYPTGTAPDRRDVEERMALDFESIAIEIYDSGNWSSDVTEVSIDRQSVAALVEGRGYSMTIICRATYWTAT